MRNGFFSMEDIPQSHSGRRVVGDADPYNF